MRQSGGAAGAARAKASRLHKGLPEDRHRDAGIAAMLRDGRSRQQIEGAFRRSRSTMALVEKQMGEAETVEP